MNTSMRLANLNLMGFKDTELAEMLTVDTPNIPRWRKKLSIPNKVNAPIDIERIYKLAIQFNVKKLNLYQRSAVVYRYYIGETEFLIRHSNKPKLWEN